MFNDIFGGVQRQDYLDYIASMSGNLVANGDGLLGNNYNFPGFTFDTSDSYSGRGSFRVTGHPGVLLSSEFIPVNPALAYEMSLWMKEVSMSGARTQYAGIGAYDVDGNSILAIHYGRVAGTDTTLAAPLNVGDTTVTLASAANWNTNGVRNLSIFGYKNAGNTLYDRDVMPYTRYVVANAWTANGDVNTGTGVITLAAPFSIANPAGGAWPIGTKVSRGDDGGNYQYCAAGGLSLVTGSWTSVVGRIAGISLSGAISSFKFPPGTARCKLLFLPSYGAANTNVILVNSVRFAPLPSAQLAIYTLATLPNAGRMTPGAMAYVSNATGGAVPVYSNGTNWLKVTDGTVVS